MHTVPCSYFSSCFLLQCLLWLFFTCCRYVQIPSLCQLNNLQQFWHPVYVFDPLIIFLNLYQFILFNSYSHTSLFQRIIVLTTFSIYYCLTTLVSNALFNYSHLIGLISLVFCVVVYQILTTFLQQMAYAIHCRISVNISASILYSIKTFAELKIGKRKERMILKDSFTAGKSSH